LARWLGPWAAEDRAPEVLRSTVQVAGHLRGRLYRPVGRAARGAVLLVPGLHYLGPDDPRLDRFAAILAHAGGWVLAPYLPDFLALRLAPTLISDTRLAFESLESMADRPPGRPGVVSISFGSLPALRLAADLPDRVGPLLTFGGFSDWRAAMRFCLTGRLPHDPPEVTRPHDPLNRPVVFLELLPWLPDAPADPAPLAAAWRAFVEQTWGRPEMKAPERWRPVAAALAETLPAAERPLFLEGCGARDAGAQDGGLARVEVALSRRPDPAWLDPRPHLGRLRGPCFLVHGADDDVIPPTELAALRAAIPAEALGGAWVTGLYGHTGHGASAGWAELRAMLAILGALSAVCGG
jgi:pimeloyl-ACP methyl ester carboxylesterase